jgi:PAS domain-containing protein
VFDNVTRVHLGTAAGSARGPTLDPHRLHAAEAELASLQGAMDGAPYPIWQTDDKGRVVWSNPAYAALCRKTKRGDADAARALFDPDQDGIAPGAPVRVSIPVEGTDHVLWYDVHRVAHDGFSMHYAVDINAVVNAEIAQRNFVQTLAKTFAQLSTGLAIFDRKRQLALFNPALVDLTALPADFLSSRPNLLSFFDRLRDNSMMPEPKNYGSWRKQMADLVAAAADGSYRDTWTLPSGSVYSVSGRPHPDGAVAFLFEDITADVTLTRRFRSDLELGQAVLDQLDEALVVFRPDGVLDTSNAAYNALWSVDPDSTFCEVTVADALRTWQARADPSQAWSELRAAVTGPVGNRWEGLCALSDGTEVLARVRPVQNGTRMVTFRPTDPARTLRGTRSERA